MQIPSWSRHHKILYRNKVVAQQWQKENTAIKIVHCINIHTYKTQFPKP